VGVVAVAVIPAVTGCFLIDPAPPFDPSAVDAAGSQPIDAMRPVDAALPIDAPPPPPDAPWPAVPRVQATRNAWMPVVQTLRPPNYVEADFFGGALGLSADGRLLAVSAPNDRTPDANHPGSVRVYEDDGTGTFVWRQFIRPPNLGRFGGAVAIEGGALAITEDGFATSGRVHMFRRDASGVWQPEWSLATPPTATRVGDEVHFDGAGTVVVSMANALQGYLRSANGTWLLAFMLQPALPRDAAGVYASSFAIDGDRMVVGDTGLRWPGDTTVPGGGAIIYERTAGGWTVAAVLPPVFPDAIGMGSKVAVSGDDVAIASDVWSHRVEMWHRGADGAWTPTAHLWAAGAGDPDWAFGSSLALTPEVLLVGTGTQMTPLPGDPGHAFRFVRSGNTWAADFDLVIPGAHAGDNLGIAMDAAANRIVVGANLEDGACPGLGDCNAGAVYVITMP
jgi:hypothetical protein